MNNNTITVGEIGIAIAFALLCLVVIVLGLVYFITWFIRRPNE